MKGVSQSFEAAGVQSKPRNVNGFSAPFGWRLPVIGLCVFAGYYLGAKIGFALTFQPYPVSVLWPPNSILVAALLLTPPHIWWFVLLAAFPAHCAAQIQSDVPPLMILSWFVSNSSEAVLSAGLACYLVRGPIQFTSLRNAGIFCLCAVFAGPFLSSFLDAAFVRWNAWGQASYWDLIRIRFFSNALAALIVVPLIVTWATNGILAVRKTGRAYVGRPKEYQAYQQMRADNKLAKESLETAEMYQDASMQWSVWGGWDAGFGSFGPMAGPGSF
jgi:MASE1